MSDLIVGIVLALLAGTVLPFATSQAAGFIEGRRDLNKRRRELYEKALLIGWDDPQLAPDEDLTVFREKRNAYESSRGAAISLLRSSFALFDGKVSKATRYWGSHLSTPEDREIMRLWANGNRWTARLKARRLLKVNPNIIAPPPQE